MKGLVPEIGRETARSSRAGEWSEKSGGEEGGLAVGKDAIHW